MRSPADIQQLRLFTHCTCTAFGMLLLLMHCTHWGSSLFSMIGFGASWAGAIGGVCGLLACIGSSILMCCAPASAQEGGGKFTAVRKSTLLPRAHPTIRVHHASPSCAANPARRPLRCSSSLASSS